MSDSGVGYASWVNSATPRWLYKQSDSVEELSADSFRGNTLARHQMSTTIRPIAPRHKHYIVFFLQVENHIELFSTVLAKTFESQM